MRHLVLSCIDFKEENGISKPYIKDLDKKYEDFYKGNTVYKMEIDMLLDFIRIAFEIFETEDIALAKSVEEVNDVMDKFGSSITKTYENFAVKMISEAGKKAPYKIEGVVYAVDMSQVTSVVSLIKQTYDVIQSMYDKKVIINMFMDIAKNYENKVKEKEKNRMEDTQKYQSIKIYVLQRYSDLLREKDASKVIEVFKEGISVISQMVEGTGVRIVPGTEEQIYPKPRKGK